VHYNFGQRACLLLGYAFYWLFIFEITISPYTGNEQFWWVPPGFILLVLGIQNYRKFFSTMSIPKRRRNSETDPYDRSGI